MDILSFGLGIAVVVVIVLSVISVIAFFKVKKIEKQIEQTESAIYKELQFLNREKQSELAETHRRIDDFEKEVYSQLDSRLDKLENKLTTKK
jgi:predicted Holliday junction resolvase-like endonuclease